MTADENLLRRFLKDDSKTDELECFLSTLGGASQQEKGRIKYPCLEVEYDGKSIKAIRSCAPHCPNILADLDRKIDEAIYVDHGSEVCEAYFFTYPPVVGVVRIKDVMQIIPVPDGAPRIYPPTLIGDHPAILQFTYDKSTNFYVDMHRREKRKRELLLLINVIVRNGISWFDNTAKNIWTWDVKSDGLSDYGFKYCQVGYSSKQVWGKRDGSSFFVNQEWPEIPRKSHSQYYGDNKFFTIGEPFQLPASFEASVARYHKLVEDESALFMRSAYWLAKCSDIFNHSQSLAYVSLVYALEGLVPGATQIGKCNSCGRGQFNKSISARFKEFLEEYGADLSKSEIDEIYSLRSKIAHGGGLMPRDGEITGFRFTAEQNEKDAVYRRLRRVCEVVLINWLYSDKRTTAP